LALKSTLNTPGAKRLTLKYDDLLLGVAFKFTWRRYKKASVYPRLQQVTLFIDPFHATVTVVMEPKSMAGTDG
jgi:hypothetical protein